MQRNCHYKRERKDKRKVELVFKKREKGSWVNDKITSKMRFT